MSEVKTNKISPATGTAFTLGDSGDTFTVPSGASIVNSGTATGFGGGKVLQMVTNQILTAVTGTTTTPFDDTIPQNTEGNEIITQAITPTASDSTLIIQCNLGSATHSGSDGKGIIALYQDTTADALATGIKSIRNQGPHHMGLTYKMTSGTTSSTTFKIRIGSNEAGTLIVNHASYMADTQCAILTIWEVSA